MVWHFMNSKFCVVNILNLNHEAMFSFLLAAEEFEFEDKLGPSVSGCEWVFTETYHSSSAKLKVFC